MVAAAKPDTAVRSDDEFRAKYMGVVEWYVTALKAREEEVRRTGSALSCSYLVAVILLGVIGNVQVTTLVAVVGGLGGMWLFNRWRVQRHQDLEDQLGMRLGPVSDLKSPDRDRFFDLVFKEQRRRGYR